MDKSPLTSIFDGWQGYNTSLVRAASPLTPEQLAFRAGPEMRSVGEVFAHIALGRIDWFSRMDAPGAAELALSAPAPETIANEAALLVHWLEASWRMVENVLSGWTLDDLWKTYHQPYEGQTYLVSHQWVVFRILAHDIQHGGQLTILLAMQGIEPLELTLLGGHIVEPPLLEGPTA